VANLQQIEKYLKAKRIPYKLISLRSSSFGKLRTAGLKVADLGGEVFTVDQVKKSGVDEGEIVKTLIIRVGDVPYYSSSEAQRSREVTNQGNSRQAPHQMVRGQARIVNFAALAVRGKDRVDFKKVRGLFGPSTSLRVNCELAKPEEVKRVVGVPVGAVCPILIEVPLYFDQRVMDLKHVNMGSGDLTKGLEMELSDLLSAVGKYQIEDLVL